jgi:poly(A) polymerase Pap1
VGIELPRGDVTRVEVHSPGSDLDLENAALVVVGGDVQLDRFLGHLRSL